MTIANHEWGKAIIGALVGSLITGFLSMAMFTSRMATMEQRIQNLESNLNRSTTATDKLIDATNDLANEVKLLRQRINRLDPDGR